MKRALCTWLYAGLLALSGICLIFFLLAYATTSNAEPLKNPTEMTNVSSQKVKTSTRSSSKHEGAVSKKTSERKSSKKGCTDPTEWYGASYFMYHGEIYSGGWRYTWYSENVLPGGGLYIPGRHVDDEGYVVDNEGRLVAASEDIPYGTEIGVPFGSGVAVVRDCGCPNGTIDIYVSW